MGDELRDRTFGAIGFGGIAGATVRLLANFKMKQPIKKLVQIFPIHENPSMTMPKKEN